jgi:hypothetical protein
MWTNAGEFKDVVVDTLAVQLDTLNPRIDVAHDASQDALRTALFQTEDILDLASGILENGGMLPGERIIVLKEGRHQVVLEGNRRVCACQVLLDRSRIPTGHKTSVPGLDEDVRKRLLRLQADLAPSREAAEYVITRRHTEPGIKRWSIVAKQRRIARFLQEGHTLEEAANYYNEELYQLRRVMQGFGLLAEVRRLPTWTAAEKKQLQNPSLVVNPFIRFFQLAGTKDAFGITFDEVDAKVAVATPGQDYEKSLENAARLLLLPDQKGRRAANTRTEASDLLPKVLVGNLKTGWKAVPKTGRGKQTRSRPTARAAVFFESLSCQIKDDRLAQVSLELRLIDYRRLPTAAAFLVRALVEASLDWCIREYKLGGTLSSEWKAANPNAKFGPGLEYMLNFVIRNHAAMFADKDIKRPLGQWLNQHKDGLDMVIHGKWRTNMTGVDLEQVASVIRPAIQRILDRSALL